MEQSISVQNNLNKKGKIRLAILLFLSAFALFCLYLMLTIGYKIDGGEYFALAAAIPCFYYYLLHLKLHNLLEEKVLKSMGFAKSENKSILEVYNLSAQLSSVSKIYEGAFREHPVKLIDFSAKDQKTSGFVTVQTRRNSTIKDFKGIEFTTQEENLPIQLHSHSFIRSGFNQVDLESNDFNKIFKVYAQDPKSPFYQLDPDTMDDLMRIKKELNLWFNLETKGNKVFVYIFKRHYDKLFKGRLAFKEVLNEEISNNDLEHYRAAIENFLDKLWQIYETLDLKPPKYE